jgi:K+-transporting ATPase c subunit
MHTKLFYKSRLGIRRKRRNKGKRRKKEKSDEKKVNNAATNQNLRPSKPELRARIEGERKFGTKRDIQNRGSVASKLQLSSDQHSIGNFSTAVTEDDLRK